MDTPNQNPDSFNWTAAEADVADAEVLDLDAERERRAKPDTNRSFVAEVDDETDELDTDAPMAVNPPAAKDPSMFALAAAGKVNDRRPIVPAWMRTKAELKSATRWVFGHYTHVGVYHLTRSPKYAVKLGWRAPFGVARTIAALTRWTSDAEGIPVRLASVRAEDAELYLKLSRQRDARVRWRGIVTAAMLLLGAPTVGVLMVLAGSWQRWLALAAAVILFGRLGGDRDKPIVDTAVVKPRVRKLTLDVIERAFLAAGLCKSDDMISIPKPIARDGDGWVAYIDVPYWTNADKAVKKRLEIAAGLDLDEVQVWPERVRGTAGSARRVRLWVADEDPYAKASEVWPLVAKGRVDVFSAFPFGLDQRGRIVPLVMMFTSLLIGSIPRMGKTNAARIPGLACALDPSVELHIYDGKGGQDWRGFTRIAHRTGFGVRTEVVEALVEDLRALVDDMNRRYDTIATLDPVMCPESKVTRQIADKRSLKLWPILVSIDEFQRYSSHPEFGKEIVELLTELCKVGPAVGIMISLHTQKPDGKAVPTDLRDNIGTRFALKTMTWQSSEAVLGAGSYPAGYDSSRFQRSHKGVGILLGADDSGAVEEALTVRTNVAAAAHVETVIERAYAMRAKAGTLSGAAIGEAPVAPPVNAGAQLLDDIAVVLQPGETKVWSEVIVARLADLRPESYDGLAPEELATLLNPLGIDTMQIGRRIDGKTVNRRGIAAADIHAAITERDRKRRAG